MDISVQVGDYHVILWTAVLLVAITIGVIYVMLDMGSQPLDSQLKSNIVDKKGPSMGSKGDKKQS